MADHCRPILLEEVKDLIGRFLRIKRVEGSPIEKDLYKDMSEDQFITRLFKCRPLVFFTAQV